VLAIHRATRRLPRWMPGTRGRTAAAA
jgi:hypothetical protein